MNSRQIIQVLAAVTMINGCTDPATLPDSSGNENSISPLPAKEKETRQGMTPKKPRTGGAIELPALTLAPAIADLAKRLRVNDSDIEVLRATAVTWNNGAIGCPQPDSFYTEALVPGFWVVLGHAGKHYSYHATRKNSLRLCENALTDPAGDPPHGRLNEDI